jgi:ArsR family transcriptional regulator, arsenate/arsenite/antimonite-responsive transcriptional repressor
MPMDMDADGSSAKGCGMTQTLSLVADSESLECCSPLAREPLSAESAMELAGVLKAIADPTRLRLLSLIQAHEGGEACVCDLTDPVGLTQPTVSHHLRVLLDAGLVTRTKRGTWAYYQTVPDRLAALAAVISAPQPT